MKVITATPSPFARKVRVALHEKAIPFEEQIDVPWNPETQAPDFNPLGKIPILLCDDGRAIYDSRVIVEHLETLGRPPRLLPEDPVERVAVRQIEALTDGICDAVVLIVLEKSRNPALCSADWVARQKTKVVAGIEALEGQLGERQWFAGNEISLADVAAGCALGYLDLRLPDLPWRSDHPALTAFSERMESRPSFEATKPEVQIIAPVG